MSKALRWPQRSRRGATGKQRGLTIIELMIGMALGLFLIAGTLTLFAGHVTSNNALMRTIRLNNELRGTLDLIIRDLRRASYWGTAQTGAWFPGTPGVQANPFLQLDVTPDSVTYRYDVDGDGLLDADESFRIQHNAADGAVEMLQLDTGGSATSTVPVSDADLTNITALAFTLTQRTVSTTCLKSGSGPVAPTPPVLHVREIFVTITGTLRSDATVTRTLSDSVRVQNDRVEGSCPT
jgi:Tfp pilus assembly protein PilW